MKQNVLNIPGTNDHLNEGAIIILSSVPQVNWLVRYGWYIWNQNNTLGWFLQRIPDGVVRDITDQDLMTCTIVYNPGDSCHRPDPICKPELTVDVNTNELTSNSLQLVSTTTGSANKYKFTVDDSGYLKITKVDGSATPVTVTLFPETEITAQATNAQIPSSLAVKNYVDAHAPSGSAVLKLTFSISGSDIVCDKTYTEIQAALTQKTDLIGWIPNTFGHTVVRFSCLGDFIGGQPKICLIGLAWNENQTLTGIQIVIKPDNTIEVETFQR